MKGEYIFNLNSVNYNDFFPEYRLKNKLQILKVMLEASRLMMNSNYNQKTTGSQGRLILKVDKMKRLFFVSEKKIYSIVFPFKIQENDDKLIFFSSNDVKIDSWIISNINEILQNESFYSQCCLDFSDPISDFQNDNKEIWNILRDLLMIEDGYIRFDNDPINHEKFKKEGLEKKHPLNHFDIYFSQNVSFKIGLDKELRYKDFLDVLDPDTDCKILK